MSASNLRSCGFSGYMNGSLLMNYSFKTTQPFSRTPLTCHPITKPGVILEVDSQQGPYGGGVVAGPRH